MDACNIQGFEASHHRDKQIIYGHSQKYGGKKEDRMNHIHVQILKRMEVAMKW